jgi:hypothetical protein
MGIDAAVETEWGEKIASLGDPTSILPRVLPPIEDQTYRMINYIDWYGNTVFNCYQIPVVRLGLLRRVESRTVPAEAAFLRQLEALAASAEVEPHLYLKFYGD